MTNNRLFLIALQVVFKKLCTIKPDLVVVIVTYALDQFQNCRLLIKTNLTNLLSETNQ